MLLILWHYIENSLCCCIVPDHIIYYFALACNQLYFLVLIIIRISFDFKEIIRRTGIPAIFTDFCEEAAHLASCCISSITGQPLKIPVCVILCHCRFFPIVGIEKIKYIITIYHVFSRSRSILSGSQLQQITVHYTYHVIQIALFWGCKISLCHQEVFRDWFVNKWQCNFPKKTRVPFLEDGRRGGGVFFSERWWNGDLNFNLCWDIWNLRRQVAQITRNIGRARNSMCTSRYKEEMYFIWTSEKYLGTAIVRCSHQLIHEIYYFHNWKMWYMFSLVELHII